MTPSEIAESYDQLAEQWNSDEYPRDSGIEQHKRAIAFLKETPRPRYRLWKQRENHRSTD
jgi:hypothetical protein